MEDILIKAGAFVTIILLGYLLKRLGVLKQEDFLVLSKIVLRVTAPAAIAISISGSELDPGLLTLILLGLASGVVLVSAGYLANLHTNKNQQSFEMLNLAGYNIGTFALPFVQSFLGPVGLVTVTLFDVGNAMVALGGAFGAAATVKDGRPFSFRLIADKLLHSVPFVCYILLVSMSLAHISLPAPVLSGLQVLANANPFMAMFMIGVGLEITGDKSQLSRVFRVLVMRYGLSGMMAALIYFLTPFHLEVRQTLVILLMSPISSIIPAFTAELEEDVGLSSVITSLSIVVSIVIIIILLMVML